MLFAAQRQQAFLGTSAAETLSASGNIFVGQTEAPLLIKPFFGDMTKSEIHAVMTGGCVSRMHRCLLEVGGKL
jgi:nucleoside permease NupC